MQGFRSLIVATAVFTVALTGCAADVPMNAAVNANDPACADVIVRLPETVDGLKKRHTNAQSTGAWGEPADILLRCGIEPSGPTTDSCVSINGVDWIMDDSREPIFRFEAYGRSPGLEVIINSERVGGSEALVDLGSVTKMLPQTRQCLGPDDPLDFDPEPEEG